MKITIFISLIFILFSCANSKQEGNTNANNDTIKTASNDKNISNEVIQDSIISEDEFDDNYISDGDTYVELVGKDLDSANIGVNFYPKGNYLVLKAKIKQQREKFTERYKKSNDTIYKQAIIDSAGEYITNTLLNDIFPFWYGTPWDFDGYTEKPNNGVIACGYFVSTTLRDVGFNLNRFRMAQQDGLYEAKTVQLSGEVKKFIGQEPEEWKATFLKDLKEGLYFVGLDSHVGYVWVHNNEVYFIHSNYYHNAVELEYAENSEPFISETYYIADISINDSLITKWVLNEVVDVVKP